jgi:uncharacterized protein (TIGR03435 family)
VKPHILSGAPDERAGIEEDKALVRIDNLSLRRLIGIAYRVKGFQIAGPNWPETFDIVAKLPTDYQHDQLPALMQKMLSDRFRLAAHHETRTAPAYALVIAKGGPKLHESAGPRTYHTGRPGLIEGHQWSMTELADSLTGFVGASVANQTGLGAVYDLKFEWNPQELAAQSETGGTTEGPSLFTALQEQLGLRLEPTRVGFCCRRSRGTSANSQLISGRPGVVVHMRAARPAAPGDLLSNGAHTDFSDEARNSSRLRHSLPW